MRRGVAQNQYLARYAEFPQAYTLVDGGDREGGNALLLKEGRDLKHTVPVCLRLHYCHQPAIGRQCRVYDIHIMLERVEVKLNIRPVRFGAWLIPLWS